MMIFNEIYSYIYAYMYISISICMYAYIYVKRAREKEKHISYVCSNSTRREIPTHNYKF